MAAPLQLFKAPKSSAALRLRTTGLEVRVLHFETVLAQNFWSWLKYLTSLAEPKNIGCYYIKTQLFSNFKLELSLQSLIDNVKVLHELKSVDLLLQAFLRIRL